MMADEYTSDQFLTIYGAILYRLEDDKWWDNLIAADANDVAYESDVDGHPLDFDGTRLAGGYL
jgi:hypothetical protein